MKEYSLVPFVGRLKFCVTLAQKQKLKNKTIFDIGSSNGLLASYLLKEKPRKYEGIDPNKESVTFSNKHNKGAKFTVSTADKLPAKTNSFDVALMFDVIEHVPADGEVTALKEVNRILKKGGSLLLSTPNNNIFTNALDPAWYLGHRHYYHDQIKSFLSEAGFKVKSLEVRGNLWFSIYLISLYISKWIFKNKNYRNEFLERMDNEGFSKRGIHTIFVVAEKK